MTNKYNNDIYKMYEKEVEKVQKITCKYNKTRWEVEELRYDNKKLNNELSNINSIKAKEVNKEVERITKPIIEENKELKEKLLKANEEINRLKKELAKKDNQQYELDKLKKQINADNTNSGIPSSKVLTYKKNKTGANIYNHREKTTKLSGGQLGHKGKTLTTEQIEKKIKNYNIETIDFVHYVKGNKPNRVKFKFGAKMVPYVEKHTFIYGKDYQDIMSESFHSDVTYTEEFKSIIAMLSSYCCLSNEKIQELLAFLTDNFIEISDGTINNFLDKFSAEVQPTIGNIKNNLLNGSKMNTDLTTTTENGKETYFRGYSNEYNVLYKYHHHKGDGPIENDGILTNFCGTIISDHEVGIFKYGKNNQDCVIHIGRYCNQFKQNVFEIYWPIELYTFLLQQERNRKILEKYEKDSFTEVEKENIKKKYDEILERAKAENENINSSYWKKEAIKLFNRMVKHKDKVLCYIDDFSISYDNNFMENLLRMIKNKTKMSGGFRSHKGGVRFGEIISIIKTARLRNLNPYKCVTQIYQGKVLFA